LLSTIEKTRLQISKNTGAEEKSRLGQFFTPAKTAVFMAGLFPEAGGRCHLLDAGAGIGSLSGAFLERCMGEAFNFDRIKLTAFELDKNLHAELHGSLRGYADKLPFALEITDGDFIEAAVNRIQFGRSDFTHAILNPPYKKIKSNSRCRLLLRQAGIETVNLYSAFVALSLLLVVPGGQVVAIVPRSFCNGPYYRPFRGFMLKHAAVRHIHLFESRSKTFRDDGVLQENIVIRLERGGKQGPVTVSTSTDDTLADFAARVQPFNRIVIPADPEQFIHVPVSPGKSAIEASPSICYSLNDIGIKVSTGPVVDFRLKKHLRDMPEAGTVPLLYAGHFTDSGMIWPQTGTKKPNAICRNSDTEKWLYPNGFYCVVRRFSSKEERRRIVASVVNSAAFNGAPMLGFENHLNLFHQNRRGLPQTLARGLAVFLNTTAVDEYFRCFSGHTQVNATDLKLMKYPSRETLINLGRWAMQCGKITQAMVDDKLETLVA